MKDGRFDVSKIPDIYDCIKYDLQHNQKTIQYEGAKELFECSKALADIVIPQVQYRSYTCKPTFIPKRENSARFARASLSGKFMAANQPFSYGNNKNTKFTCKNISATNQFIACKLRNNSIMEISWFTVSQNHIIFFIV